MSIDFRTVRGWLNGPSLLAARLKLKPVQRHTNLMLKLDRLVDTNQGVAWDGQRYWPVRMWSGTYATYCFYPAKAQKIRAKVLVYLAAQRELEETQGIDGTTAKDYFEWLRHYYQLPPLELKRCLENYYLFNPRQTNEFR